MDDPKREDDRDWLFVARFSNGGYIRLIHHQFLYGFIVGGALAWWLL